MTIYTSDPTSLFRPFTSSGVYSGEDEKGSPYNRTDLVFQNFKLFIEGVQIPFISMTVNQGIGSMPSAFVEIPPEQGLMDIVRGYQPKVHIFFEDLNQGGERLLFWGFISSCSYSRSRATGQVAISFQCVHKNSVLRSVLLDYSGWLNGNLTDSATSTGAVKMAAFNSSHTLVNALMGTDGVAKEDLDKFIPSNKNIDLADSSKLDPSLAKFANRLVGIPGCAYNLWNQYKASAYKVPAVNMHVGSMIAPLVEEGIGFFKRMSGHFYLENQVQDSKETVCHDRSSTEKKICIPPAYQTPLISAVKSEIAINALNSQVGFSGEFSDFFSLLENFLATIYYDIATLASPAEVVVDPGASGKNPDAGFNGADRMAVETIIKPQIPFYFSPVCNVILPRMFSSIQIEQDESAIPTRVTAFHSVDNQGSNGLNFRAPPSIREATAYGAMVQATTSDATQSPTTLDLRSTINFTYSVPGKYEQGIGIKPIKTALPWWLAAYTKGADEGKPTDATPDKGSAQYDLLMKLMGSWNERYTKKVTQLDGTVSYVTDPTKAPLNPYDPDSSNLYMHQRLLMAAADYEYSKYVAGSRRGSISAVFNPYIIPGYPMDVIDDNPNHPSFHGLCVSVTHTITSSSVSTTIGMDAATTYAELSNYYTPPIHPSLQGSLNVINGTVGSDGKYTDVKSTLLQNPVAKSAADQFYLGTLGVASIAPDDLFNFTRGRANGLARSSGLLVSLTPEDAGARASRHAPNGGELNDYLSTVGNLRMVSRAIETRKSIETKFDLYFIDLTSQNYNNSFELFKNPNLTQGMLLEPGANLFLDYQETPNFINVAKQKALQTGTLKT